MTVNIYRSDDSPDDPDELLRLTSGQLDGELVAVEFERLSELTASSVGSERSMQFEAASLGLRRMLRKLPMNDVGQSIVAAVAVERTQKLNQSSPPLVSAEHSEFSEVLDRGRHRSAIQRKVLTASSLLVAACVVLISMNWRMPVARISQTGSLAPRSSVDSAPDAMSMLPEISMLPSMIVSQEVLLNGDDWKILAVRLMTNDRVALMDQIQLLASDSGLQMQPASDDRDVSEIDGEVSDRFGILLTSAPEERDAFLEEVRRSPHVESSEWDPDQIAHMDREQLIAAVRQSMQSPTRSELHFGEVYLAVPADAATALSFDRAEQREADSSVAASADRSRNRVLQDGAVRSRQTVRGTTVHGGPILVVFELRHREP